MKLKIILFVAIDILIVSIVLLFVFAGGQQGEASATAESVAPQQAPSEAELDEFLNAYRMAHRNGDVDAAMRLVCRDGGPENVLELLRESMAGDFQMQLADVQIAPLDDSDLVEYTLRGVRYVPNLKPVGKLLITLVGDENITPTTSYLVGVQNGRYRIATSKEAQ